jgi:hypothetical protein
MKINPIMAVLAFLFGLGGSLVAYSWSGLSADLATNASITLVASILGLIGIYLFEKDYKIAIAQYIISGLGVLIGTSMVGIPGFIFYVIAAIVAYIERDQSGSKTDKFDEIKFYGNEQEIRQRYPNFPTNADKNNIYWIIPVITLILIVLSGVMGDASYNNDLQEKANGIDITNISSDLKVSYGYYTGGVQGTLSSQRDIQSVQIKGVWYGEDGSQIDQTYDTNTFTDIKANQKYQLNIPYYKESNNKPVKVEIQIFENFDDTPLYTKTVNFN